MDCSALCALAACNPLSPPPRGLQVLNKEKIFVFGELLEMENVQALRGTEFEPHLKLLELFAYGTYSDYAAAPTSFPELSKKMIVKLRMLSIVSLAHLSKKVPYADLLAELGVGNVRDLEDLIIDTIYAGLLDGRLNQAKEILNVRSAVRCPARDIFQWTPHPPQISSEKHRTTPLQQCLGQNRYANALLSLSTMPCPSLCRHLQVARDVRPEAVAAMAAQLAAWGSTVRGLLGALDGDMARVAEARLEEATLRAAVKEDVDAAKKALEKSTAHLGGDDYPGGLGGRRAPAAGGAARSKRSRDFPGMGYPLGR